MEVHKQYDLRRKGNIDNLKDNNTNTAINKNTETQPKKKAKKTKILTKKPDINKDRSVEPNVEQSTPSTSASGPNKIVQITSPNKVQQIKIAEKNSIEKTDVNMNKPIVPFSLEGVLAI